MKATIITILILAVAFVGTLALTSSDAPPMRAAPDVRPPLMAPDIRCCSAEACTWPEVGQTSCEAAGETAVACKDWRHTGSIEDRGRTKNTYVCGW